jgi:uncharacterized tellurite resistance protein B-like protein
VLEVGEWDQVLRLLDVRLPDEEAQRWLDLLADRAALEARFAGLSPPPPAFNDDLLHQSWRMALADGNVSDVERAVHDRIADRLGVDADAAARLREDWTKKAGERAELVVSFAAAMIGLDGHLDGAEAVQFDSLLERMPLPVVRRLELAGILYHAPQLSQVAERLRDLDPEDRLAVLCDIVPLVRASARGDRERAAYLELAERAAVSRERALRLLEGRS